MINKNTNLFQLLKMAAIVIIDGTRPHAVLHGYLQTKEPVH